MNKTKIAKEYYKFYKHAFDRKERSPIYRYITIGTNTMAIFETVYDTVFVFKGTDEFKDWGVNLRIFHKEDCKKWESHNGFDDSAEDFSDIIKMEIKKSKKDIVFIGYSLGAAIALISAIKFNRVFEYREFKCVTFGQPRVFNYNQIDKIIKKMDDLEYYRVYFDHDIISKVPTKSFGYCHLPAIEIKLKPKLWHKLPLVFIKILVHKQYKRVLA